jgi:hypothetical protein
MYLAYVLYIDFFVRGILYNVRPHRPPRLPRGGDRGLVVYARCTLAHPHVLSSQERSEGGVVYAVRPHRPLPPSQEGRGVGLVVCTYTVARPSPIFKKYKHTIIIIILYNIFFLF